MKGKVLAINAGSTSTKIAFYDSEKKMFEENISHPSDVLAQYDSVMDQDLMRMGTITEFLFTKGITLDEIDVVMSRTGLVTPMETGVYEVLDEVRDALKYCRNGVHACNLSGIIAADIAAEVNRTRKEKGIGGMVCKAYLADPPMADEMLPEVKLGGIPEFPRRPLCHALNSRAMIRRYAREKGVDRHGVTAIVAHIGGGTSVTLHRGGKIIDTNDALGGEGPISTERAGTVPAFPLIEMCFSGKYTQDEIKRKLVGRGGAVAWFGTNDFKEILKKAETDEKTSLFVEAFCLSIAKYIAGISADVCGKVDVIILTGGVAHSAMMMEKISRRVSFIAPVVVYPGENEMDSLAENAYGILSGEFKVKTYHPNRS